jgi:hypothetical protein
VAQMELPRLTFSSASHRGTHHATASCSSRWSRPPFAWVVACLRPPLQPVVISYPRSLFEDRVTYIAEGPRPAPDLMTTVVL